MRLDRSLRLVILGSIFVAAIGVEVGGCGGDEAATVGPTTTSGVGGAGAEGGGGGLNCVVDGQLGPLEECDDGNDVLGDGCENDCSFTCTPGSPTHGDIVCDDVDPCNGLETCTDAHTCDPGTAAADGTNCAPGKICKSGVCEDDTCGDGFVSASEECDDANVTLGDGCDDCKLTCLSTDPAACTPADECEGQGTCDDATHTCSPGTALADGTPCAQGFCQGGTCTPPLCGNGFLEPPEECDDGNAVDLDGCNIDCTLTCSDPVLDCPAPPVCQLAACDVSNVCAPVPDPSQNGAPCGPGLVCSDGACAVPGAVCGNGVIEGGEQCDFGAANGPNAGCETTCLFSCTLAPDSCPDADSCNGVETCGQLVVNAQTGQACSPGAPLADCSLCAGGVCSGGTCQVSTCGDGCIDAAAGEQCEPPNTATCDATCQSMLCGNGVREGSEQCDDGGLINLDGCDSSCKFEQDLRANWLKMQFGIDAYCTVNQIGKAIVGGAAQSQLQQGLDTAIASGDIGMLFKLLGLDDLTGTSDPAVEVGVMDGPPVAGMGYDGTSDLDWWYDANATSIDANRDPIAKLPGTILAKVLDAGPGTMNMTVVFSGVPKNLKITSAKLTSSIGATSTPLSAAMPVPPGHLASEHVDPALVSFESGGQKTANGAAKLCGNVSALSLAQIPIPPTLVGGGLLACSQNYTAQNSMLDLLIGGCTVLFIQQIAPTQPDTADPGAPEAGAGAPYTLQANAQKVVNVCKDKDNVVVNLQTCLNAAAYSSFFKFATGRVIVK